MVQKKQKIWLLDRSRCDIVTKVINMLKLIIHRCFKLLNLRACHFIFRIVKYFLATIKQMNVSLSRKYYDSKFKPEHFKKMEGILANIRICACCLAHIRDKTVPCGVPFKFQYFDQNRVALVQNSRLLAVKLSLLTSFEYISHHEIP